MCNSWLALNYVKDNNDNIYDITNNDKGNIVYYIIIIIMIITLVSIFKSNWFTHKIHPITCDKAQGTTQDHCIRGMHMLLQIILIRPALITYLSTFMWSNLLIIVLNRIMKKGNASFWYSLVCMMLVACWLEEVNLLNT